MSGESKMADSELTLSEILETGFLKCEICKAVYDDPRLLPCLHTFCKHCIDNFVENKNQSGKYNENNQQGNDTGNTEAMTNSALEETIIQCPICKSEISVENPKKVNFPQNTFLHDLCLMYEYKHEKHRNCDYCQFEGKVVGASHLCLDCHDNMCQGCTGAHHRTKVTRDHKVIPYAQAQKGLYDIDIRRNQVQLCDTHDSEHLSIFCDTCEVLICKDCKVESHDKHKWSPNEKALTKYEIQMRNLHKGIQHQIPTIHNYIQFLANYDASLERNREKTANSIKEHAEALHKQIEEQKSLCIEALNMETDKERCMLQVRSQNLKTAAISLENNEMYLRVLLEHGKPDEILQLHRPINQRLTALTHMQMDGISTRLKATFQTGSSTLRNIQTVFGKMSISHDYFTHSDSGLASHNALQICNMLPSIRNTPELINEFEAKGMFDTKEVWPTGIAVTKAGEFVIADRDNKIVKVYDKSGNIKQEICGQEKNKLATPFDVAVLKSGDIAVTDHEAEDVKVYRTTGEHVMTIKDGIKYPRGVTVNSKGQVIILDCQLRQLTVHDPNTGNLIKTIEGKDNKNTKVMVDPYYVTVTPQDNIIVTDTASPNLKVFSPTGEYLARYGHYGIGKDEILQPYGVCCDEYGYIFVADNNNHRIHVLLPDGKFQQFFVTKTENCWHPMGLAITSDGCLAITEALGKIKVYKYL
ncbi:E3 ubiquitin-protein ligase TRIM71-like [Dreissena polymorpha]|uniref:Uncharacterized protein n=1 Tax=Dreissena polymorpha TaxID=45954 RepID=A0A9D4DNR2_DREPO|nr:E3 ubiquitin-protein ligase TRIM71-like [Dreissena polymorpha]KAH3752086.1 hypothetical protein DPMN_186696 [Dreissena polymorpha]